MGRRPDRRRLQTPPLRLPLLFLSVCAGYCFAQNPSIAITWPPGSAEVANIADVKGTAQSSAPVSIVNISVDGGPYTPAMGTSTWYSSFYAKLLPVGPHTLSAQVVDAAGNTASSSVTVNVVHSSPACAHSAVADGIFCQQRGSDVESATPANPSSTASITFPDGYTAGDLIIVGVSANDRGVPWLSTGISNTAGYQWTFWGNVTSGYLDNDLVQVALYYTRVPSTITAADTITVTDPGSTFTIEDALVYSGVGEIDGAGGSFIGWGGYGVSATTNPYTVSAGDLNIAFNVGAPTAPGPGWAERLEDISRPYSMFIDQRATGTTATGSWTMNVEGFISIGIAFRPLRSDHQTIRPILRPRK